VKCVNEKRVPIDFFMAERTAGHPAAILLAKIVEGCGLELESYPAKKRHGETGKPAITCICALKKMLGGETPETAGAYLQETLATIEKTWGFNRETLAQTFLGPLYALMSSYGDIIKRPIFVNKLGGTLISDLRENARAKRYASKVKKMTAGFAMQCVIADFYNQGLPAERRIPLGS
jgi:hypothetical protein